MLTAPYIQSIRKPHLYIDTPDSKMAEPNLLVPGKSPVGLVKPKESDPVFRKASDFWSTQQSFAGGLQIRNLGRGLESSFVVEPAAAKLTKNHLEVSAGSGAGAYLTPVSMDNDNNGAMTFSFRSSINSGVAVVASASDTNTSGDYWILYLGDVSGGFADESLLFVSRKDGIDKIIFYVANGTYHYCDGNWHTVTVIVDGVSNRMIIDGVAYVPTFNIGAANTNAFTRISNCNTARLGSRRLSNTSISYDIDIRMFAYYQPGSIPSDAEIIKHHKDLYSWVDPA